MRLSGMVVRLSARDAQRATRTTKRDRTSPESITAEEYRRRVGAPRQRRTSAKKLRNSGPLPSVQSGEGWAEFLIPVRVTTGLNAREREHHMDRARRVRAEHEATTLALTATREGRAVLARLEAPYLVALTAITPSAGDDDNRIGGLKGVRDAIATILGVNDGDASRVTWAYGKPERGKWAVRARIEGAESPRQKVTIEDPAKDRRRRNVLGEHCGKCATVLTEKNTYSVSRRGKTELRCLTCYAERQRVYDSRASGTQES